MKTVVVLLLCLCPLSALSCSCFDFTSRRDTIRSGFCDQYPEDVYVATVVEATCNCLPMSADSDVLDASIHCQNYTASDTCSSSNVVYVHTLARGDCDYDRGSYYGSVLNCSTTSERLVPASDYLIEDMTNMLPPLMNVTDPERRCRYVCSFNDIDEDTYPYQIQPCIYTVTVDEVFKGNYTAGESMTTPGPDVLTSCGAYGRILQLESQYVVGIGHACSDIGEWSELESYSEVEIGYLRFLRDTYSNDPSVCDGAIPLLPSRLFPLLVAMAIVMGSIMF